jgi:hypothetical protein
MDILCKDPLITIARNIVMREASIGWMIIGQLAYGHVGIKADILRAPAPEAALAKLNNLTTTAGLAP